MGNNNNNNDEQPSSAPAKPPPAPSVPPPPEPPTAPSAPPPPVLRVPATRSGGKVVIRKPTRWYSKPRECNFPFAEKAGADYIIKENDVVKDYRYEMWEYWFDKYWYAANCTMDNDSELKKNAAEVFDDTTPKSLSDEEKREVLVAVFDLGHVSYEGDFLKDPADVAAKLPKITLKGNEVPIAYRADSRPAAVVEEDGGLASKVDSKNRVQKFHFSEEWHPFSKSDVKDKMYYRRRENDNCLDTIVSIARELEEIFCFPLIDDKTLYPDPSALPKYTGKTSREYFCTESVVYIFKVNSDVVMTEMLQEKFNVPNPFPERGIKKIPKENLLAKLVFDRHHYDIQQPKKILVKVKSVDYSSDYTAENLSDLFEQEGIENIYTERKPKKTDEDPFIKLAKTDKLELPFWLIMSDDASFIGTLEKYLQEDMATP
jgi:hypothetical protein